MQATRFTRCSRCARPLVCAEDLACWLEAVMRAGTRVYCSLECSEAAERLDLTGDIAVKYAAESLQP